MKLIIPDTNSKEFRAMLTSTGDGDNASILALRGYVTPERMTQVALAAIRREPALLQCRVESLLESLTLCMEAGLEPDGRNAHLLAEGDSVRVVFDWKGLVALGRRRGVEAIHADVVCQGDHFGVGYDGGAKLTHEIDYRNPRGDAYAAYCYYILDGEPDVEVMTREEIERERATELAAAPGHTPLAGLWQRDWASMARRAVVMRASLRWPGEIPALETPPPQPAHTSPTGGEDNAPSENGDKEVPQGPLGKLTHFMRVRKISEASMLDYLKEEGRIADYITQLADVPGPVIEDVVSSWVEMMEEAEEI